MIHGRRVFAGGNNPNVVRQVDYSESATEADQSRLLLHRPLLDGDVVTYDFLYQPGQVMVHPAIDRLAFLIEPDGVKLHWMTAGGSDLTGLAADNVAEEPENRRGPKPLPLKSGEWNAIKMALDKNKLSIELNGQPIYERARAPLRPPVRALPLQGSDVRAGAQRRPSGPLARVALARAARQPDR